MSSMLFPNSEFHVDAIAPKTGPAVQGGGSHGSSDPDDEAVDALIVIAAAMAVFLGLGALAVGVLYLTFGQQAHLLGNNLTDSEHHVLEVGGGCS